MALMRHKSIETIVRRYLARNTTTTADALWDAERQRESPRRDAPPLSVCHDLGP
jgi:hypothetical protein